MELFLDEGRTVLSGTVYPSTDQVFLEVFSTGGSAKLRSLSIWKLESVRRGIR